MIDKLYTYFHNHKWLRVIFYIITLLIVFSYFIDYTVVFYHVVETMNTIEEVDVYNATHILCYGAGLGFMLFLVDMFYIFHCMYEIMIKHKD